MAAKQAPFQTQMSLFVSLQIEKVDPILSEMEEK